MQYSHIIYPNENGISILIPTQHLSLEDVAKKDVPKGVPYKFIKHTDIPSDSDFRGAWTADFSNPDGYGIGYDEWVLLHNSETERVSKPYEVTEE